MDEKWIWINKIEIFSQQNIFYITPYFSFQFKRESEKI